MIEGTNARLRILPSDKMTCKDQQQQHNSSSVHSASSPMPPSPRENSIGVVHFFGGVFVGAVAEVLTAFVQVGGLDSSSSSTTPVSGAKGGLKRKRDGQAPPTEEFDATPQAPEGRAATRAKAAGQGCTSFVSECSLPTDKGNFRLRAYRYRDSKKAHEPVVMVAGDVRGRENVPVRVHDQCQTSEV